MIHRYQLDGFKSRSNLKVRLEPEAGYRSFPEKARALGGLAVLGAASSASILP